MYTLTKQSASNRGNGRGRVNTHNCLSRGFSDFFELVPCRLQTLQVHDHVLNCSLKIT